MRCSEPGSALSPDPAEGTPGWGPGTESLGAFSSQAVWASGPAVLALGSRGSVSVGLGAQLAGLGFWVGGSGRESLPGGPWICPCWGRLENHRISGLEETSGGSSPTPCSKQDQPQLNHPSQGSVKLDHKNLGEWRFHHLPREPSPGLHHPPREIVFPNIQPKPPPLQLETITPCAAITKNSRSPSSLDPTAGGTDPTQPGAAPISPGSAGPGGSESLAPPGLTSPIITGVSAAAASLLLLLLLLVAFVCFRKTRAGKGAAQRPSSTSPLAVLKAPAQQDPVYASIDEGKEPQTLPQEPDPDGLTYAELNHQVLQAKRGGLAPDPEPPQPSVYAAINVNQGGPLQ
ncbi:uncharacterized protein ACDP82_020125 [Pangshura tecta]